MTEQEKQELVELFAETLERKDRSCPLGIYRDTARELIDFACAWKQARKTALITLIGAFATSLIAAVIAGIKASLS
ncbi:MAG: hypothetical protein IKB25_01235 [Lentisphaeria bacterium]|nr:hypothetical protein [Lentisphaeria bacterium]